MVNLTGNFEKILSSYGKGERNGNGGNNYYNNLKLEINQKYIIRIITPFFKDNIPFYFSAIHGALRKISTSKRIYGCLNISNKTLLTGDEENECPICSFVQSDTYKALMKSSAKELKRELFDLKITPSIQILVLQKDDETNTPQRVTFYGEDAVKSFLTFWDSLSQEVKDNIYNYYIGIKVNQDWKNRYQFVLLNKGVPVNISEDLKNSLKKELESKEISSVLGFYKADKQELMELLKTFVKHIKRANSLIGGKEMDSEEIDEGLNLEEETEDNDDFEDTEEDEGDNELKEFLEEKPKVGIKKEEIKSSLSKKETSKPKKETKKSESEDVDLMEFLRE